MDHYQNITRIKSELSTSIKVFFAAFNKEILPKISADLEYISSHFPSFTTTSDTYYSVELAAPHFGFTVTPNTGNCALLIPKGYDVDVKGIGGLLSGQDLIFVYSHHDRVDLEQESSATARIVSGLDVEPRREEVVHNRQLGNTIGTVYFGKTEKSLEDCLAFFKSSCGFEGKKPHGNYFFGWRFNI